MLQPSWPPSWILLKVQIYWENSEIAKNFEGGGGDGIHPPPPPPVRPTPNPQTPFELKSEPMLNHL